MMTVCLVRKCTSAALSYFISVESKQFLSFSLSFCLFATHFICIGVFVVFVVDVAAASAAAAVVAAVSQKVLLILLLYALHFQVSKNDRRFA